MNDTNKNKNYLLQIEKLASSDPIAKRSPLASTATHHASSGCARKEWYDSSAALAALAEGVVRPLPDGDDDAAAADDEEEEEEEEEDALALGVKASTLTLPLRVVTRRCRPEGVHRIWFTCDLPWKDAAGVIFDLDELEEARRKS